MEQMRIKYHEGEVLRTAENMSKAVWNIWSKLREKAQQPVISQLASFSLIFDIILDSFSDFQLCAYQSGHAKIKATALIKIKIKWEHSPNYLQIVYICNLFKS